VARKFDKTSGTIVLDKEKGTGTLDITVDTSSIDFGHQNSMSTPSPPRCSRLKVPTATYKGTLTGFKNGCRPRLTAFTLHGVTIP